MRRGRQARLSNWRYLWEIQLDNTVEKYGWGLQMIIWLANAPTFLNRRLGDKAKATFALQLLILDEFLWNWPQQNRQMETDGYEGAQIFVIIWCQSSETISIHHFLGWSPSIQVKRGAGRTGEESIISFQRLLISERLRVLGEASKPHLSERLGGERKSKISHLRGF